MKYSQKNTERAVTIAELQGFAKGFLIDIPSFVEGELIKVKVKRLDLTKDFLKRPEVTNFLTLPVVQKYQDNMTSEEIEKQLQDEMGKQIQEGNTDTITQLMPLLDDICKQALVEPTYEDFENSCGLTMQMKMSIFGWIVNEFEDLKNFRNGR